MLLLQRAHHLLLLYLGVLQLLTGADVTPQQLVLIVLGSQEHSLYMGQFLLLLDNGLTLRTLVLGIMAHENQTTVHLREALGAEDEHQLTLGRAVAMHVAHRTDILTLVLVKLVLQLYHLLVQQLNGIAEVSSELRTIRFCRRFFTSCSLLRRRRSCSRICCCSCWRSFCRP